DAIGLVFYPPSPRAVTQPLAREICLAMPPFVTTVALFVDPTAEQVESVLSFVPVDMLQFHGKEAPAFCAQFGHPFLKALKMSADMDLIAEAGRYQQASGILVDSYHADIAGGSGEAFDWSRLPTGTQWPLILAGGLDAGNVAQAIKQVRPYAVDISSGVESDKGIKDAIKVTAFINEVQGVQ
ncbi:MAG TPA: phosphoribosylanthranilate isomerase, partial [Gammaproteobacteria bacterium]|nr:phosphoribosylanthranilate isomerase [Gammaproteobacteria bacterium]